jgi:hypothetical protein
MFEYLLERPNVSVLRLFASWLHLGMTDMLDRTSLLAQPQLNGETVLDDIVDDIVLFSWRESS